MPGGRPVVQQRLMFVMVLVTYCGGTGTYADWADCPNPCQCKWSSGKKTALCRDADLSDVPASLDGDMQVLDLSSNDLRRVPEEAFKRAGLLNLQRVFLRGCGVRDVHRDAFAELKILVELDLSDNLIGELHPETFHGNERLRVLYLNGNPLTEIREAQFPVLQHLRTLELQHCRIRRVHRDAFVHLSALESLNLNGNLLEVLSETVFLPVAKLKTLSLDGNPWVCDCRLRSFRNWFVASNLYAHPLSCNEPKPLSGGQWQNVEPLEFACPPDARIDRPSALEDTGGNVTFACRVTGDPAPEVSWYFNGRAVDNYTDRMEENRTRGTFGDDDRAPRSWWSALTVFNVSDAVAGEYTCEARNSRGRASANASLALPEAAVVATTLSQSGSVYVAVVCAVAGAAALLLAAVAATACCACGRTNASATGRRDGRKGCSAAAGFKGSSSFCSDADKRLLDASISTCTQAGSCEMLQGGSGGGGSPSCQDLELMEQSLQQQPPVHITIESHDALHGGGGGHSGVSVYPPPPEFSTSVLPSSVGGYGNIFISVSVSQEPPPDPSAECRYPDLLDMKHRGQNRTGAVVRQQPQRDAASYYATMPRKNRTKDGHYHHHPHHHQHAVKSPLPHYDNMGPRITAAGSCTNLSTLSIGCGGGSADDIPPPPPPPMCTGHVDYVAL